MAWRAIQDTVRQSESLASVSSLAERLYWRLLAHSDPYGRLPCTPKKLRATCYPLLQISDQEAAGALLELESVDRIRVYEKTGSWYLQLTDFEENQPREAYRKRNASTIPEPPKGPTNDQIKAALAFSGTIPEPFRIDAGNPCSEDLSGNLPELLRKPSGPDVEETETEETREATATRARTGPETAAALNEALDKINVTDTGLRTAAHQDLDRALACALKAETSAKGNPAGYFRRLLESGEHPTMSAPAKPTLSPVDKLRKRIKNGTIPDLDYLNAELTAANLNGTTADELRALLPVAMSPDDDIPY